jgi:hypothetical protein
MTSSSRGGPHLCIDTAPADDASRSVLTDADLAKYLSAQGVLCWGGDIRDRDAYQGASLSLSS